MCVCVGVGVGAHVRMCACTCMCMCARGISPGFDPRFAFLMSRAEHWSIRRTCEDLALHVDLAHLVDADVEVGTAERDGMRRNIVVRTTDCRKHRQHAYGIVVVRRRENAFRYAQLHPPAHFVDLTLSAGTDLTRALEGGGGKKCPPLRFFADSGKTAARSAAIFQCLLTIELDTLC